MTKSFPGVRALDAVQFTLRAGEIHALMGENGAGKSTLIKILTGVYQRDAGSIHFEGREIFPRSPRDAEEVGISTVYQEVNLVPNLSVAENILLGRQPTWLGLIRWRTIRQRAQEALARLGLQLDVGRELGACPIAIQQMVAIARALDVRARSLILDEPTSSLDDAECQGLFQVLRRLRDEGMGIAFVTHFLDQVYTVTDRITVLRNGGFVGEFETARLPRLELIGQMLGRSVEAEHQRPKQEQEQGQGKFQPAMAPQNQGHATGDSGRAGAPSPAAGSVLPPVSADPLGPGPGDPHGRRAAESAPHPAVQGDGFFLEARGLTRRGVMQPIDLSIGAGEVVGLAGLLGSGRTETARMLFGIDRRTGGDVSINGRTAPLRSPREAVSHGLAFCSEDRKLEGVLPNLSVRENLILALQSRRGILGQLRRDEQLRLADHYIRALNIRTPSPETPIRNLSGGNQQKVLLARWLALQPKLIILDEPTRGIDIGAKAEIEKLVASLREQGLAVLYISSELEEIVRVSQRVIVLRDRRKVGELTAPFDEQAIMTRIAQPHER